MPCRWDDGTFANHGDVSYGTAPLVVWDPTYLHLTPAVYVPSAAAIDISLSGDANVTLLGTYSAGDAGGWNHMQSQDCVCTHALCGFIVVCWSKPGGSVETPAQSNCQRRSQGWLLAPHRLATRRDRPIWPKFPFRARYSGTLGALDIHSTTSAPRPAATQPPARDWPDHQLGGRNPHRGDGRGGGGWAKGDLVVEQESLRKKGQQGRNRVLRRKPGAPVKPGTGDRRQWSPPIWEALSWAPKNQQLLVLQQSFDTAAEDMGIRASTIAKPSLLKLVLALGFRMDSRDDLTTGFHPSSSSSIRPHSGSSYADRRTATPW